MADRPLRPSDRPETAALRRLRRRIDALDRRIVGLLNERAEVARTIGREKDARGRGAVRDAEREREVLLRVSIANDGPLPQADLLAIYRRLIAATRRLEATDRATRPEIDSSVGTEKSTTAGASAALRTATRGDAGDGAEREVTANDARRRSPDDEDQPASSADGPDGRG